MGIRVESFRPAANNIINDLFDRWRANSIDQCEEALEKRLRKRPYPSLAELHLGVFFEQLEPQVRDAVFAFNKKGYMTCSSGFKGVYQTIEGHFILDSATKVKLCGMGVNVYEMPKEICTEDYTLIEFKPECGDDEGVIRMWKAIADILPNKGKQSAPNCSTTAFNFRMKYTTD